MYSNFDRRFFLKSVAAGALLAGSPRLLADAAPALASSPSPASVEDLPELKGKLTLYLGRGEGGLYENILDAIVARNPDFDLKIRRGSTAALANMLVAESRAKSVRADVFWAVDSGAIGTVMNAGLGQAIPTDLKQGLATNFQYDNWLPISGRIRTLPFNTEAGIVERIPKHIMDLPSSGLKIAWAPSYAACQSFITAMRLQEGENATINWLKQMDRVTETYAGELGVVMAVERGEADIGLANHYYALRLKKGKPKANVDLAFTQNDAGCLLNASGAMVLSENSLASDFVRYLHSAEVQRFLSREAYEIPMVQGVEAPQGIPPLSEISPPKVDLNQLADLRPTIKLLLSVGIL